MSGCFSTNKKTALRLALLRYLLRYTSEVKESYGGRSLNQDYKIVKKVARFREGNCGIRKGEGRRAKGGEQRAQGGGRHAG